MNKRITFRLLTGALFLLLISSTAFAQGDNSFDATVNLGLIEGATVTGNAPEGGRGIISDILWDVETKIID